MIIHGSFLLPSTKLLFFTFSDDDDLDADRQTAMSLATAEWPGRARQSSLPFLNAWAKKHRQKSINQDRIITTVSKYRVLGVFPIVAVPRLGISSQRTRKPPSKGGGTWHFQ